MNNKIKNILINKAKLNEMAHLYIVEPNKADYQNFCHTWLNQILQSISSLSSKTAIENHQDILTIVPEKDAKQYNKTNLQEIFDFINYKAITLDQKFIIIPQAHKLSEINSNKLLKTFEEPPIKLTVFLINPHKTNILPTISSRAVQLKLLMPTEESKNFFDDIMKQELSFAEFSQLCDSKECSIDQLLSDLVTIHNESNANFESMNQLKKDITSIQEDLLFHNSAQNIKLKIYNSFIQLK
jgi:hypothetical protein